MKCRLPMRIGGGGGSVAPTPVSVTITGTGNTTYCYATIGGTKRYGAGTYEVMPGDKITFGVYGRSTSYTGKVTIDGTDVLSVTNQTTQTYEWTVPDGISAIAIAMTYTSSSYQRRGTITVTTTKKPTGGGGGASEYAVTIADTSGYLAEFLKEGTSVITIGDTQITQLGTYTAKFGDTVTLTEDMGDFTVYIRVNGTVVKTATGKYTYTHTITANTKMTYTELENAPTAYWDITTE